MTVDWVRVLTFIVGIFAAFAVYFLYGSVFDANPDTVATLLTIFSILCGFQLMLFPAILSISVEDIGKPLIKNEARRQLKKKYLRQYILLLIYIVVIIGLIFSDIFIDSELSLLARKLSLSLAILALIISVEIPRLIWQLICEK